MSTEPHFATASVSYAVTDGTVPVAIGQIYFDDLLYEEIEFMRDLLAWKFAEIKEHRAAFHERLMAKAEEELASSTVTAREEPSPNP